MIDNIKDIQQNFPGNGLPSESLPKFSLALNEPEDVDEGDDETDTDDTIDDDDILESDDVADKVFDPEISGEDIDLDDDLDFDLNEDEGEDEDGILGVS